MNKITLLPYRILPCDYGYQLDERTLKKVSKYFTNHPELEIISNTGTANDNEIIMAKHTGALGGINLFSNIYSDGIGIFTLVDQTEEYTIDTFDPRLILDKRKRIHKGLLSHTHEVSKLINDNISGVRSLFRKDTTRLTASKYWEKGGLSYVMSFYFINCDINLMKKKEFQEKLALLLFPFSCEYDFDYFREFDFKRDKLNSEFIKIVKEDSDILPHIHMCASWSNFLVIGKISDKNINEYWKLQRDFQHVWFYSYITDKFIENSLKNISVKTSENKLEILDNFLTTMILKISQYEGIISSTLHERDFKLYNTIKVSSRLDILVNNIEKKSKLLKDRLSWLLAEKRFTAEKRIQFILFIIAIISFVASWEKFAKLGFYNNLGLVSLIILVALCFFKAFLSKKEKN